MKIEIFENKIEIPNGLDATVENGILTIKGSRGEIKRAFRAPNVILEKRENYVILYSKKATRKEKRMIRTFGAHIKNMINGMKTGFIYELKICSSHFPMKVVLEDDKVIISNFFGERTPRVAQVLDGVNVKIDSDMIIVEGVDIEKTGQTAANIERATRITNRDRRVFMDGIWIVSKPIREN